MSQMLWDDSVSDQTLMDLADEMEETDIARSLWPPMCHPWDEVFDWEESGRPLSPLIYHEDSPCPKESIGDVWADYHATVQRGCKTCWTCKWTAEKFAEKKYVHFDACWPERPIPGSFDKVEENIVSSLPNYRLVYQAQPAREDWRFYVSGERQVEFFDYFEKDYWLIVKNELDYLQACRKFYHHDD